MRCCGDWRLAQIVELYRLPEPGGPWAPAEFDAVTRAARWLALSPYVAPAPSSKANGLLLFGASPSLGSSITDHSDGDGHRPTVVAVDQLQSTLTP